jgi:glycosyltransferase involved in cell wall biosynthesis
MMPSVDHLSYGAYHKFMNTIIPKISVVIPTYNMGRFLPECLTTIAKQEYPKLEIIIIDGLSNDNTSEVIKRYGQIVTTFISEKDNGQPDAVTKGLKIVTGDIIHWHAADDIVLPGAFHRVAREFTMHKDIDLIFSDGLAISESGISKGSVVRWTNFYDSLLFFGRFQSDCAYWRHGITDSALPLNNNKQLTCDEDFFMRMWVGHKFRWIPQPLGAFRSHGNQISQRVDRSTVAAERKDTRQQIIANLRWSEEKVATLRRRHFLHYYLCNRFAVKAYSGIRFLARKLTGDILRKRYSKFIMTDWMRPIY